MSLVNCFIPPPKHPITKGKTVTLYCSRLLRNLNANCSYFCSFSIFFSWMFNSQGHAISTMQIIFFDSSSNVRSGHLAMFVVLIRCSQSQRSLYPFLVSLFLSPRFHSTILCLVEVRHCWLPIGPPAHSVQFCVVERNLCWLIFRNQLEVVALFTFVFGTTDIDHYHLVLSSSSMPSFRPFVPACSTQLQSYGDLCRISAIHNRLLFGFWVFHFAYSFGSAFPFYFVAALVVVSFVVSSMRFPSYLPFRFQ